MDLIKTLLQNGHKYVLPGKIQSNRVEGEFGIYRQNSGGNYFISVDQVISSLSLERIKPFNKLDIAREENRRRNCCAMDKSMSVDDCFEDTSNLTCIEKSTLYYISGYITKKQRMQSSVESADAIPESEFTQLVSRGKLSRPPGDLYDLSQYFFCYFKAKKQKCCNSVFLHAFKLIYESTGYSFSNIEQIIRRFVNCFFKAFTKDATNKLKVENDKRRTKKRRLSSR